MVGLFLQSGYALLPSKPHHRVSSRLTRNLILFVARQGGKFLVEHELDRRADVHPQPLFDGLEPGFIGQ